MEKKESQENYLEAILILSKTLPVVRSIDVSKKLGYKKSSVSVAVKHLREDGLITVTAEGYLSLTEEGFSIAEMIFERHQLLSSWLIHLGVEEETAMADACRIEHDISPQSFEKIKEHILSTIEQA